MPHYVVLTEQGPGWSVGTPMRGQAGWSEHASFMNQLTSDGWVVLGGPLGPGVPLHRALLIARAPDEASLRARLAEDPWMRDGQLRIREVLAWEPLLGELPATGPQVRKGEG